MLRNLVWLVATVVLVGVLAGVQANLPAGEEKGAGDRNPACAAPAATAAASPATTTASECPDQQGKPGERK